MTFDEMRAESLRRSKKESFMSYASVKEIEQELEQGGLVYALVPCVGSSVVSCAGFSTDSFCSTNDGIDVRLQPLIREYSDVFPEDLPTGLPPIRGIELQIDLIPGAPLPNKAPYRSNPEKTKELQRQIGELMESGYIRESMSPCAVPTL